MDDRAAIALALARPSRRAEGAAELARLVGADALIVFASDPEIGKLLPAPGFPQTLPGGAGWRRLLAECAGPGVHRGEVCWPDRGTVQPAIAWVRDGTAFVFVGAGIDEAEVDPTLFPLVGARLEAELAAAAAEGREAAARQATQTASELTEALDHTRARLQGALAEQERLNAELERAMQAKDEFLAMLGHELRNPLAPIVTALHLLRLKHDPVPREVEVIRRHVDHVVGLVDDLLDISRIVRGKIQLERAPIELADVALRAVEMASPLFEQKHHHFVLDVPRGLTVDADGARLAQVLSNLLTNAARYTPAGGDIAMSASAVGREVEVSVRDNGIGISGELLPRVFDLFVQGAQRDTDRREGGLGIGLALVRNLVTLHGGSVRAGSEGPGRGSTFTVRLALAQAAASPTDASVDARTGADEVSRRVLVVDDNEDALELLEDVLRAHGHVVLRAHDGPTALERVDAFRPDVAILDIGLPVMDGYELARLLAARPATRDVRLVALSGYGLPEDRARAASAGFHHHLTKPVDLALLLATLAAESSERPRGHRAVGLPTP